MTDDQPDRTPSGLAARLAELDALYAAGQITATELGEARRRLLGGHEPGHPEPERPETAVMAAPASGGPAATRPAWLIPALAAGAVVVLMVVGAVLLLGGGGAGDGQAAKAATPDYLDGGVRRPLDQLTSSAVTIGKSLGRVSEPDELRALNRSAERQLDVVEAARRRLSRITVTADEAIGHRRLVAATATHRRYLVELARATSGTPGAAQLRSLDRARKAGAETIRAYRSFFVVVPSAPDAITATDLTDTVGVRTAIQRAVTQRAQAAQDARAAAAPPAAAPSAPSPPRGYSGTSFQSPTGNLRCQDQGTQLFCSSSNDGFGVFLPQYGAPSSGSGVASGGVTVPYGSSWSSGAFRCSSAFDGITCRNLSGNGFFLNRDTYRPF